MASFAPLDHMNPSQILRDYDEWVYFTLVLVFFISVSGLVLRRHFDKSYVKPLVVSVGLMLTVGLFRFKETMVVLFEGWGIVGTVLMVMVVAVIPYGLTRTFGMPAGRTFYLTYVFFYILSWVKFSAVYTYLGERNLGLVNLALLVFFFYALYKTLFFKKGGVDLNKGGERAGIFEKTIDNEIRSEERERQWLGQNAEKISEMEIGTILQIQKAIEEIEQIIGRHLNNLSDKDRRQISDLLNKIVQSEGVINKGVRDLEEIVTKAKILDNNQMQEMRSRYEKASGKKKKLLKIEIEEEERKREIEKRIGALINRFLQQTGLFHAELEVSIGHMRNSAYPLDALSNLTKAREALREMVRIQKRMEKRQADLINISKIESKVLKKEKA